MSDDNKKIDVSLVNSYLKNEMESFSVLIDIVKNTMDTFVAAQLPFDAFEILSNSISQLIPSINDLIKSFDFNVINHTSELLLECFKTLSLPAYDFSSLVESISIEDDYVMLEDNALDTLTEFFNEQEESVGDISSRMSIKDFLITILLPLVCMILPMIQNNYYHKLDAIEAQQHHMLEVEYREAILNLETQHAKELEKLNNNISELLQYLESAQDTDLLDSDVQSLLSDVEYTLSDSLPVEIDSIDEPDNSDTNLVSD